MDTEAFSRAVRERIGALAHEQATRGTAAVFHALHDRFTPDEAEQGVAQLSGPLKAAWGAGERRVRSGAARRGRAWP
jgi:uncharacterized protein (DUF2267 family)